MQNNELWIKLIKIHELTKSLLIKGEEFGNDFKKFIQPYNELVNSYEHIIRALSNDLGLKVEDPSYLKSNLDKALGHEYRAFFDTADWLSIVLRKRIQDILNAFPPDCIDKGLPNYYSTIRPRLDKINQEIAELRGKKDIGNGGEIVPQVEYYEGLINELFSFYQEIVQAIPSIKDFYVEKSSDKSSQKRQLVIVAIVTVVCTLIGTYILAGIPPFSEAVYKVIYSIQ